MEFINKNINNIIINELLKEFDTPAITLLQILKDDSTIVY